MLDLALDVGDAPARITLVPEAVELLGGGPELYDEVAGQVLWLGLPTLLAPELDQGCFVITHDDPGIRAADEHSAVRRGSPQVRFHRFLRSGNGFCCTQRPPSGIIRYQLYRTIPSLVNNETEAVE